MIGVLISSFNRPNYLHQCLESVRRADLSKVGSILIVDDASTDPETIRLINEFDIEGVEVIKAFSKTNRSIKGSLLFGLDLLFNHFSVVTNLDGDAVVHPQAFNKLIEIQHKFPLHISTGFNCSTKNRDGSVRHRILEQFPHHNFKKTVGGLNMIFGHSVYLQAVRPALEKCLKSGGNWDEAACLNSYNGYDRPVVCIQPSVCQHIGIESSMGHSAGGEPPDQAEDFQQYFDAPFAERMNSLKAYRENVAAIKEIEKEEALGLADENSVHGCDITEWEVKSSWRPDHLWLPEVTLIAVDCVDIERVFKASDKCLEKARFGSVKIFTSLECLRPRCENIIQIDRIYTKEEYSWFIMKQLAKNVATSHVLIFQHDGYILNPGAWDNDWLQYDYIGAPWEWYPDNKVGNGGFSLRSKKLMDAIANDPYLIPVTDGLNTHKEEDHCICRIYRKYLEDRYGIKFAPIEVARRFSIEGYRSDNKTWTNEFGFHGSGLTNIKP